MSLGMNLELIKRMDKGELIEILKENNLQERNSIKNKIIDSKNKFLEENGYEYIGRKLYIKSTKELVYKL